LINSVVTLAQCTLGV